MVATCMTTSVARPSSRASGMRPAQRSTPLSAGMFRTVPFTASRASNTVVEATSMRVNVAAPEKCSYETMVVLRPDLGDEARDSELAKFEAFLQKSGAEDIQVTIRGRQRLAYPIKSFADGIYVLYTYDASPQVVAPVQKLLSTPTAGAELNVLRHMTFRI